MTKQIVNQTLMLAGSALLLSLAVNYLSPAGIGLVGQWDTRVGVVSAVPVETAIEINNPVTARRIVLNRERIVLDVRPLFVYEAGHIPGAHSFPLNAFEENFDRLMDLVRRQSPILVYCSGLECEDSHSFARRLAELGFTDVRVYAGGFMQWEEMGFDIEAEN